MACYCSGPAPWPRPGASSHAARGRVSARARLRIPGPASSMARPGTLPGPPGVAPLRVLFGPAADPASRRAAFVFFRFRPRRPSSDRLRVPGPAASASRPGFSIVRFGRTRHFLKPFPSKVSLRRPRRQRPHAAPGRRGLPPLAHGRDSLTRPSVFRSRFRSRRGSWAAGSPCRPRAPARLFCPSFGLGTRVASASVESPGCSVPPRGLLFGVGASSSSGRRLRSSPSGRLYRNSCFKP